MFGPSHASAKTYTNASATNSVKAHTTSKNVSEKQSRDGGQNYKTKAYFLAPAAQQINNA